MRNIQKKGIGVLLLAVSSAACDSSMQESETAAAPLNAAASSNEIPPASVVTQDAGQNTEITATEPEPSSLASPNDRPDVVESAIISTGTIATPVSTASEGRTEQQADNSDNTNIANAGVSDAEHTNGEGGTNPVADDSTTEPTAASNTQPNESNDAVLTNGGSGATASVSHSVEVTATELESSSGSQSNESLNASNTDSGNADTSTSPEQTQTADDVLAVTITSNTSNTSNTTSISHATSESQHTTGGSGAAASASSNVSLDLNDMPDSSATPSTTLFVDSENNYCSEVGDVFDLNVSGVLGDAVTGLSSVSLSSYATLDLDNHPNVQVVSHSDESISVAVTNPDIVDLMVQYENQHELIYLSAVSQGESKPLILRKNHLNGSCSFALYTDSGCAVLTSNLDMEATASVDGTTITAQGCTLGNPAGLPVIELE